MPIIHSHTPLVWLSFGGLFEETGTTENSFIMALGQFHHHTVAFLVVTERGTGRLQPAGDEDVPQQQAAP